MQERQDAAVHVHHQCECPSTGRPERPWSKSIFMYLCFSELVVTTEEICSNQQEINFPSGSFKSESVNAAGCLAGSHGIRVIPISLHHGRDDSYPSCWWETATIILTDAGADLVGDIPKEGHASITHLQTSFLSFIYLFCVEYYQACTSTLVKTHSDLMHSPAPPH